MSKQNDDEYDSEIKTTYEATKVEHNQSDSAQHPEESKQVNNFNVTEDALLIPDEMDETQCDDYDYDSSIYSNDDYQPTQSCNQALYQLGPCQAGNLYTDLKLAIPKWRLRIDESISKAPIHQYPRIDDSFNYLNPLRQIDLLIQTITDVVKVLSKGKQTLAAKFYAMSTKLNLRETYTRQQNEKNFYEVLSAENKDQPSDLKIDTGDYWQTDKQLEDLNNDERSPFRYNEQVCEEKDSYRTKFLADMYLALKLEIPKWRLRIDESFSKAPIQQYPKIDDSFNYLNPLSQIDFLIQTIIDVVKLMSNDNQFLTTSISSVSSKKQNVSPYYYHHSENAVYEKVHCQNQSRPESSKILQKRLDLNCGIKQFLHGMNQNEKNAIFAKNTSARKLRKLENGTYSKPENKLHNFNSIQAYSPKEPCLNQDEELKVIHNLYRVKRLEKKALAKNKKVQRQLSIYNTSREKFTDDIMSTEEYLMQQLSDISENEQIENHGEYRFRPALCKHNDKTKKKVAKLRSKHVNEEPLLIKRTFKANKNESKAKYQEFEYIPLLKNSNERQLASDKKLELLIRQITAEDFADIRGLLEQNEHEMVTLQTDLQNKIDESSISKETIESLNNTLSGKEQTVHELETNLQSLKESYEELMRKHSSETSMRQLESSNNRNLEQMISQLNKKIVSLETQIQKNNIEFALKKEELDNFRQLLNDKETLLNTNKIQVELVSDKLKSAMEEIVNMKVLLRQNENELLNLQSDLHNKLDEITNSKKIIESLKKELSTKDSTIQQLEINLNNLQQSLNELSKQHSSEASLKQLEFAKMEQTVTQLKDKISSMETQLKQNNADLTAKDKEIEKVHQQLNDKETQLSTHKTQTEQVSDKLKTAVDESTNMKVLLRQKEQEYAALESNLQSKLDEINSLKKTVESINNTLSDKNSVVQQLEIRLNNLQQSYNELTKQHLSETSLKQLEFNKMEQTITQLKDKIVSLETQLKQNNADLTAKNRELEKVHQQLDDKETQLSTQKTQTEQISDKLKTAVDESTNMKGLLRQKEQEYSALESNLQSKLDELSNSKKTVESLRNTLSDKNNVIQQLEINLNSLQQSHDELKMQYESEKSLRQTEISNNRKLEQIIKELKEKIDYLGVQLQETGAELKSKNEKLEKIQHMMHYRVAQLASHKSQQDLSTCKSQPELRFEN